MSVQYEAVLTLSAFPFPLLKTRLSLHVLVCLSERVLDSTVPTCSVLYSWVVFCPAIPHNTRLLVFLLTGIAQVLWCANGRLVQYSTVCTVPFCTKWSLPKAALCTFIVYKHLAALSPKVTEPSDF